MKRLNYVVAYIYQYMWIHCVLDFAIKIRYYYLSLLLVEKSKYV